MEDGVLGNYDGINFFINISSAILNSISVSIICPHWYGISKGNALGKIGVLYFENISVGSS